MSLLAWVALALILFVYFVGSLLVAIAAVRIAHFYDRRTPALVAKVELDGHAMRRELLKLKRERGGSPLGLS